jgi:hypothetical protein
MLTVRGSTTGIQLCPRGGPSPGPAPGPSPLVPRGEGRIRLRRESLRRGSPRPAQFAGEGPGVKVPPDAEGAPPRRFHRRKSEQTLDMRNPVRVDTTPHQG